MPIELDSKQSLRTLSLCAAVFALWLAAPASTALDLKGRTDTGYQLEFGDNAAVNRAFNYETLDLGIAKGLNISMYGGVLSAFGDHVNSSDANGLPEASDNALRNYQDSLNGNPSAWVSYSLYRLQLSYAAPVYGLGLGRSPGQGPSIAPYDGISGWVAPTDWLRIEAFAGVPWLDSNIAKVADIPTKLSNGEFEAGGRVSASILEETLSAGLGYVALHQESYAIGTLGATTSIVPTGLGTASLAWNPTNTFGVGVAASLMNVTPLDYSAWASGELETLRLTYNLAVALQPVDASAVADCFDAFAAVLGASQAYFSASLDVAEDIAGFITAPGSIKAAEMELACDYHQPLGVADAWNIQSLQFRVGPLLALKSGFSISAYYNYLLSLSSDDSLSTLSGEIREKIAGFDFRLGTSFDANHFEANVSSNSILEGYDTQEYYLKARWQASKTLDFSLKASYSSSRFGTSTAPALTDSTLLPTLTTVTTQLNDQARNALRLDIRAGLRY
jgi:hypothetical protein